MDNIGRIRMQVINCFIESFGDNEVRAKIETIESYQDDEIIKLFIDMRNAQFADFSFEIYQELGLLIDIKELKYL